MIQICLRLQNLVSVVFIVIIFSRTFPFILIFIDSEKINAESPPKRIKRYGASSVENITERKISNNTNVNYKDIINDPIDSQLVKSDEELTYILLGT